LTFNKWFEKEHDYCLPAKRISNLVKDDNVTEQCSRHFNEISKSIELDSSLSNSSNTTTNLEKINVNNELSSCSLYAINVTTELLKDALLENQKNQFKCGQSMATSNNCTNPVVNQVSCILNQPFCNQNGMLPRLNNECNIQPNSSEKKHLCVSTRECTPPKLFAPMDIDGDMIKLFPTLDFSTEHNSNENPDNYNDIDKKDDTKNISSEKTKQTKNEKIHSLSSSTLCTETHSNLSRSLQMKNAIQSKHKVDVVQSGLPNGAHSLSAISSTKSPQLPSKQYLNIFNRYQGKSKEHFIECLENPEPILLRDLLCGSKPKTIISPYTHRHLKPYIFRDPVTKPLWLKLLNEIREHFRRKNGLPRSRVVETIDYSYVRAKHIKSVNALARQFFWPGIDLTESLNYPDFSVIALYKNLVIGFGFMVPDISTNENYITFLFTRPYWTNCGIAKFMIYHLIQTCMTRDITLHVSPNNPAMILYQKFGFKIEEFVQNFYEYYIPEESELSKHALFLRLRSNLKNK